jgi:hypothetical protein
MSLAIAVVGWEHYGGMPATISDENKILETGTAASTHGRLSRIVGEPAAGDVFFCFWKVVRYTRLTLQTQNYFVKKDPLRE